MNAGGPVAPSTEDPLLGRVLSERYRILKKLGEGGMGVVYLAEHVVIEKKIALKVLFPDLTRRADLVQRFMQEAKSASRIGHENVIDITDFGQSPEGYVFIAMEYLSGQDLGQVLKESGGSLPWARAQPIVVQIVKALRAAHARGIIHRDMKPENIFVLPRDDGQEFVKVLDFGIAKVMGLDEEAPRLTRTGMIFGTPEYMSPEQAQGQRVDHRVDIYAVGCIMYHVLTGQVPFKAESFMGILSKHMMEVPEPPRTHNQAIDPGVEEIILRAMEKDPAKRYQSMQDFLLALVPHSVMPADWSGSFSTSTGLPVPRTGVPASLSRPMVTTGTGSGPTEVTPTGARGLLPHATHEMPGRASVPLAAANPEVRRSRTEVFNRVTDPLVDRPPTRARSSNTGMLVGVGVVILIGALVLVLRGRSSTPPAGGVAPGATTAAIPSPSGTQPSKVPEQPTTAVAPVGANAGPGANAGLGTTAGANTGTGTNAGLDENATRGISPTAAIDAKKNAAASHRRRSTREAIDSLRVPEAGEGDAPAKPGVRTPAELKNPFAPAAP